MPILPPVAYCVVCYETREAIDAEREMDLDQSDPCGTRCPVCSGAFQTGYQCPDCGLVYLTDDEAIHCCNWDCTTEGYRLIYAAREAAGQQRLPL